MKKSYLIAVYTAIYVLGLFFLPVSAKVQQMNLAAYNKSNAEVKTDYLQDMFLYIANEEFLTVNHFNLIEQSVIKFKESGMEQDREALYTYIKTITMTGIFDEIQKYLLILKTSGLQVSHSYKSTFSEMVKDHYDFLEVFLNTSSVVEEGEFPNYEYDKVKDNFYELLKELRSANNVTNLPADNESDIDMVFERLQYHVLQYIFLLDVLKFLSPYEIGTFSYTFEADLNSNVRSVLEQYKKGNRKDHEEDPSNILLRVQDQISEQPLEILHFYSFIQEGGFDFDTIVDELIKNAFLYAKSEVMVRTTLDEKQQKAILEIRNDTDFDGRISSDLTFDQQLLHFEKIKANMLRWFSSMEGEDRYLDQKKAGMGMGAALTVLLVELHGGEIDFHFEQEKEKTYLKVMASFPLKETNVHLEDLGSYLQSQYEDESIPVIKSA